MAKNKRIGNAGALALVALIGVVAILCGRLLDRGACGSIQLKGKDLRSL